MFTERGSESKNIGDKIGLPFQNIKLKVSEVLSLVVEKHLLNEVLNLAIVVINGKCFRKINKACIYTVHHLSYMVTFLPVAQYLLNSGKVSVNFFFQSA